MATTAVTDEEYGVGLASVINARKSRASRTGGAAGIKPASEPGNEAGNHAGNGAKVPDGCADDAKQPLNESSQMGNWCSGSVLDQMVERQEQAVLNAQHRITVSLARDTLGMVRELRDRLTLDRAMLRMVPSEAAQSAVGDVTDDFERRARKILDDIDRIGDQMVAAYADEEEFAEEHERILQEAGRQSRRLMAGRRAADLYRQADEVSQRQVKSIRRVLELQRALDEKRNALHDGQSKVLALIEEFIGKGVRQSESGGKGMSVKP